MRLAVVTTSYPAHDGDPAGHFVRNEALGLAALGHEVHVLAPATAAGPRERVEDDIRRWGLRHGGAFGWPGVVAKVGREPWRAAGVAAFVALASARLHALRPEKVIAHWVVPSGYPIALGAAATAETEVVAHGGDIRLLRALPAPLREWIVGSLLARGVRFRFVAHALLDELRGVLPGRLGSQMDLCSVVCPPALTVPDVSIEAVRLRETCHRPIMAAVAGRLVASKRIDLAIEATALLSGQVQLNVLGAGPELDRLRRLPGGHEVRFLGQLPRERALAWICGSDVLVHPSMLEGAPTVVREARALGTRVVACAAGDVARWAEDDPGIAVVRPTAKGIAEGILLAASKPEGKNAICGRAW